MAAAGRSLLEEEATLSSHADKQGAAAIARMNLSFKAAFEDPLQVSQDASPSLKQMQDGGLFPPFFCVLINSIISVSVTLKAKEAPACC